MDAAALLRRSAITAPAVVLQASYANGLGIMRDLAPYGVPSVAVDHNPRALGFLSRYACAMLCPDPATDEAGFVSALVDLGRRLPRMGVLFPTHDEYVWAVSRNAETLSECFHIPFAAWDVMWRLASKQEQLAAAARAGVATPITAFVATGEAPAKAAADVPFPAIVKPVDGIPFKRRFSRQVLRVAGPGQLAEVWKSLDDLGPMMVQEVIPGGDDCLYSLGSYLDARSRPLAVTTNRKLRQHPRMFGTGRLVESVWAPDVAEAALRVLSELRYHGVSHTEFKRDPRDGTLKFVEVNARHWLFHGLARAAGVNISLIAYLDALGRPLTGPRQKDGVCWILALRDLQDSVREIRRGELSAAGWLRSLRGVRADGLYSLRDPAPGLAATLRTAGRAVRNRVRGTRGTLGPEDIAI